MNSEGVADAYCGRDCLGGRDIGWWLMVDTTHTTSDPTRLGTWLSEAPVSFVEVALQIQWVAKNNIELPSLWGAHTAALINSTNPDTHSTMP